MINLPIESILPELKDTLRINRNVVLSASPGAGKTTRVPLALLQEPWLEGKRILLLEPRRLAARAAARYMAAALGEGVGETVGYRIRLDTRIGPKTRIEVITEGVLTRLLQADPALEQVGLVIFDEYHERSIHADLGLALCLQSQALLRPDLRLLVMSATLDTESVAALLGNAPVLRSEGRLFPVETCYLSRRPEKKTEEMVVNTVCNALNSTDGDVLVFLPGAGEIRRAASLLREKNLSRQVQIASLYGNLPQKLQDMAIAPSPPGQRKIVLSTSLAETSLTVEGVRVVIDSGLMRVPRFSPRTGMTRLETIPVSRSSADQRRGRAGRLGPGKCFRLWTEQDNQHLAPCSTPEILAADLVPLAMELALWGAADPAELLWLDCPPPAAITQARELLSQLGALDRDGVITAHGRCMAGYGLHPRLAHMILTAVPLGLGGLACELAVVLSERDLFRGEGLSRDDDLRLRVETVRQFSRNKNERLAAGHEIDPAVYRRICAEIRYWKQAFAIPPAEGGGVEHCGLLLAFAYPDRIAQGRGDGRFLLSNGRGAVFSQSQPLSHAPYLVAAELADQGTESRILLAAPLELADIKRYFPERIVMDKAIAWDRSAQAVRARQSERLGAILLNETSIPDPDREKVRASLLRGITEEGLQILPWNKAACQIRQRLRLMGQLGEGWPDVSDQALLATVDKWLAPYLYGFTGREDLQKIQLAAVFQDMLSWQQRQKLDEWVPTHILVPSGQRIPIDYSDISCPVLAVRLQEMFGLDETPAIGGGKVILTLHLLSPAHRPVQVTRDLASFWRQAYYEVRKDLMGRYPRHYWPDDPLQAVPTNRTRPRH
ncbi:MAG: ATP-dependent helicase HrpB [Veillonellales bacterium]